jgi:gluconokinase
MSNQPLALVLMGVSGCGKTSVGKRLSHILGWPFFDGDDFHPKTNVDKMAAGIPLDDDDRKPWLANLHDLIDEHLSDGRSILLACSALKQKYRDQLSEGNPGMIFVYLKGDFDLIFNRLKARAGHYMKAELIAGRCSKTAQSSRLLKSGSEILI